MKTCIKCEIGYPVTTEYFYMAKQNKSGLRGCCKKCHNIAVLKWQQENKERVTEIKRQSGRRRVDHYKKYHTTIAGRITRIMRTIKYRCTNPRANRYIYYGGKGIKLEFTRKELEKWLSENNIDPRGLQIHRKDSSRNYVLDNIEFLTPSVHSKLTRSISATL
ncbi:MAG TPA: hypothetical protein ENH82_20035 [bacterium]|nr:hypothetical protein [bacterium]